MKGADRLTVLPMARGLSKRLAALWLIAAAGSCTLTGLGRYRDDLVLNVRLQADRVAERSKAPAVVSIRNRGRVPLLFCIEHGTSGYTIAATDKPRGRGSYVSHPGCSDRVTLDPGRSVEWPASFDLLDTPPGAAHLRARVAIVDPLSCEGVRGCEAIELESEPVPVQVLSRATSPGNP